MQRRLRLLVAVNPAASFGRRMRTGTLVLDRLRAAGHDAEALQRPSMAELHDAVAASIAARRPDALLVVGGDGMVHFGARHAAGTGLPLGIVPAGTGNDVARGLGIPLGDPVAAVDVALGALDRPIRPLDAMRAQREGADPEWVVGVASAGFDALVNERANRMRRPRGSSRYTVAMLLELLALRPLDYRLEVDGIARTERGVLLAVTNTRYFGGGMLVAPDARPDDGELDIVLVGPIGRLKFLTVFPRVFRGTHVELPIVSTERARRIRVTCGSPVAAYGDGERLGPLPVEFELVPGALSVLRP